MAKINKIFFLIIGELIFLSFLFMVLPSVFIRERPGIRQTSFENILPLDINHIYVQSFISDRDHLNSISVLLKNPSLKNYDMVYIEVQNSNHETLQELSISGRGIEDPGWLTFKFPILNSKKGDVFFIKISSNAKNDNDLYIYGNNNDQSINFKTTYKSPTLKESIKDNLNYQKDRFLNLNPLPIISYLVLLIAVNVLVFFSL